MAEWFLAGFLLLIGIGVGGFGLKLRSLTRQGEADVGGLHFFPHDWIGFEVLAMVPVAFGLWILFF